jgi:U2 small nuclear ribonucleoprotein B''
MAEVAAPPAPDAMEDVVAEGVAAPEPTPADADAPAVPEEPEYISETLYIQNLNEKIKIDGNAHFFHAGPHWSSSTVLKASLRGLFKSYGEVLDVVAHSNLRMRGQAFVSFASAETAKKAMKEVRGFPLYSKPMVNSPYCLG